MPGPCSLPNGGKREYAELWETVCNLHGNCTPDNHRVYHPNGDIIDHVWVSRREWLAQRGRLRTGKTV